MEGQNLMDFNSPISAEKSGTSIKINLSTSPGNNPFDSLCKNVLSNSPKFTEAVFDFNMEFGRESLSHLKDDLAGRESLGILKLEMLNSSLGSGSLQVPEPKSFVNSPLNTAFLHPYSNSNSRLSALSSITSSVSTNPSLFNSGSLDASEPSKIYSVNFSRNVDSKSEDILNDAFLNTFNSKAYVNSYWDIIPELREQNFEETRDRLLSLPELKTTETVKEARTCFSEYGANTAPDLIPQEPDDMFNDSVFIEAHHLASQIADGSLLLENSCFDENLLDCTSPPNFEDLENESNEIEVNTESVFKAIDKMVPAQQDVCNNQDKDDTTDINSNVQQENVSCPPQETSADKAKQFKRSLSGVFNTSQRVHSSSSSSDSSKCKDPNEILQNLSIIINSGHRDSKQNMEGQQLLFSLADILCSEGSHVSLKSKDDNLEDSGHSSIEQEEQQNEPDTYECFEVLDLRVGSKSEDNEQILDLSMKTKVEDSSRRLSQSFSFPSPKFATTKLFNKLKNRTSTVSSASSGEQSRNKAGPDSAKLKPKKLEDKGGGSKKGPLKAIIPLGNMSKRKSLGKLSTSHVTPPKLEQKNSALLKVKRTSTPISEPELKPVAQSTPDGLHSAGERSRPISYSSQLRKGKFYCPVSPLVTANSIGDSSINNSNRSSRSGSTPNLSNQSGTSKRDSLIPSSKSMYRRHSASELKVSNEPKKMQRSYSIGIDKNRAVVVDKLKQSIPALPVASLKGNKNLSRSSTVAMGKHSNTLQERNCGTPTSIKSPGLFGKLKKRSAGKENMKKSATDKVK